MTANGKADLKTQNAINESLNYQKKGVLSKGQVNDSIALLQKDLKTLGYLSGNIDRAFGNNTEKAVKAFQKKYGLTVTGLVNSTLRKKISEEAKKVNSTVDQPTNPTGGNGNVPMIFDYVDYGKLSSQFEASGSCGEISSGEGDSGGKSYGLYQFASSADTPLTFTKWLKDKDVYMYNTLKTAYDNDEKTYGSNFDDAWKKLAKENEKEFSEYQFLFTKERYYDNSLTKIKDDLGFDVAKRGYTLNAVIWSRAVQHGGCATIFERATSGMDLDKASDEEIIRAIYKESGKVVSTAPNSSSKKILAKDGDKYGITGKYLKYFSKNSSKVQAGVYNRLHITELNEALKMLKDYG